MALQSSVGDHRLIVQDIFSDLEDADEDLQFDDDVNAATPWLGIGAGPAKPTDKPRTLSYRQRAGSACTA